MSGDTMPAGHRPRLALMATLNGLVLTSSIFLGPIGSLALMGGIGFLSYIIVSEFGFVAATILISHVNDDLGFTFDTIRAIKWIVISLTLIVTIWQLSVRDERLGLKTGFVEKYFAIFILWGLVCLFFADSPRASVVEFVRSLALYLVYLITKATVRNRKHVIIILGLFTLVAFSSSFYSILSLLQGRYFRLRGFMDGANAYGELMAILLPFIVAAAVLSTKKVLRYALVFAVLLGTAALLASWSRAAIGAALIQLVVFMIAERKYRALAITGAVALGLVIALFAVSPLYDMFYKVGRLQAGTTHRTLLWETGIASIADSPILGQGFEVKVADVTGRVFWNDLSASYLFRDSSGRYNAHNHFIQAAVATGIPGLLIFVGFLYYLIRNHIRDCRREEGKRRRILFSAMLSVSVGIVFVSLFSIATMFGSGSYANYFWVALGMLDAMKDHAIEL